ncbi:MAG: hypothetical protein WCF23_24405 [Candidatus Nitrosopolaris sp.]
MYGIDNIFNFTLQRFSLLKQKSDTCIDEMGPSVLIATEPIKKALIDFRKRGIRHRVITEITTENLSYCKKLMEFVDELRHLDQIKGNFSVSERDYQATAVIQEAQPITQSMYTTVRSFIEQQRYVFDTLWHKALPARQRIKQIEEHTKREFIDTIQEGIETDNLAHMLVKSAKEEMLVMFPTMNTFYRNNIERSSDFLKAI